MTMYSEMTLTQKLGLTPEAAEELKTATLKELSELGFVNLPQPTMTETWDTMCEQVETGKINGTALLKAVYAEFPSDVNKEDYLDLELAWLEIQVDRLHGEG